MVKLHMPDDDDRPLGFGKHVNRTPSQVAEIDPNYIIWLYETITPKRCSRDLYLRCSDRNESDRNISYEFRSLINSEIDRWGDEW